MIYTKNLLLFIDLLSYLLTKKSLSFYTKALKLTIIFLMENPLKFLYLILRQLHIQQLASNTTKAL